MAAIGIASSMRSTNAVRWRSSSAADQQPRRLTQQVHVQPHAGSARVVLARCTEAGATSAQQLSAAGIPFTVVQKACGTSGNRTLLQLSALVSSSKGSGDGGGSGGEGARTAQARGMAGEAQAGATRARLQHELLQMTHNRGDECSAYLHYIVHAYDHGLAPLTLFVQYGAENQLMLPSVVRTAKAAIASMRRYELGFLPLGRHSFEGRWPAPCEAVGKQATFRRCSEALWRADLGVSTPPRSFRFYANGLFGVSRERIRARPREWYIRMLRALSGEAPSRCDGPDTRRRPGATTRLVGDCHVLEKAWHVVFGEHPMQPKPERYNVLRSTPANVTLRGGGRFFEETPGGRCSAGAAAPKLDGCATSSDCT